MTKTKVGLTFELHKKLDIKDFELATNKECLNGWNCANCLVLGKNKQAEWHSTQQCQKCSGTDKLCIRMAVCEYHLQQYVSVEVEI